LTHLGRFKLEELAPAASNHSFRTKATMKESLTGVLRVCDNDVEKSQKMRIPSM
jgi:hypothetical protein